MKLATPALMNGIDRICIERCGIPGIILMENASLAVVKEAVKALGQTKGGSVLVFAGRGNNGGDAFAAARHLINKGFRVLTYVVADMARITGDARINLDILLKTGAIVTELRGEGSGGADFGKLEDELDRASLVIDGIFGTGLKGEVEGLPSRVIGLINRAGKTVISIDIPSGIDGSTGKIHGACIKATSTVTFGLPKVGLMIHPGCEYTGELIVADIGIPKSVAASQDIKGNVITAGEIRTYIPPRRNNTNKGDYGKVLIISGSAGMTGSGCLAALASLRTGAGLVYLGVPGTLAPVCGAAVKEPVLLPLPDEGGGRLSKSAIPQILESMKGKDAVAVGPGLSCSEDIFEIVGEIVNKARTPLVLDADALNVLAKDISLLRALKCETVVTPHPGEMSRLTGIGIKDIQENRIETALEFSSKWKVITLLKGSRTVIALPDGTYYVNATGNAGMATGGAGDVLTGVIAGLIAQGARPADAAAAGAYIHGLAGDMAAAKKGQYGLIAGDVVEELPTAMMSAVGG